MAGEGFIIPIEVVGAQSIEQAAVATDTFTGKLQKAMEASDRLNQSLTKGEKAAAKVNPGAKSFFSGDTGKDTGRSIYSALLNQTKDQIKDIIEFTEKYIKLGGLEYLAREQAGVHNLTSDYRALLKTLKEKVDLEAQVRARTDPGKSRILKETAEAREYVKTLQQIESVQGKLSERNQAASGALTGLRTELELRQKLKEAQEHNTEASLKTIKAIMEEEAAIKRKTTALKSNLDLQQRKENLTWKSDNKTQIEELIKQEAAFERSIVTVKEVESIKNKLAAAEARLSNEYKEQQAALNKLVRDEMEEVAVNKLIDQQLMKAAEVRAVLSGRVEAAMAGVKGLTVEEMRDAEVTKQLQLAKERLAKAMAMTNPEIEKLVLEYKKLEKQQSEATQTGKAWQAHFFGLSQLTASFRAAMAGIGMSFGIYTSATILAASASYAFIRAVKDIVAVGAEFTKEMSIVNAAMGLSEEQYHVLEQAAIDMSASSRYSATQVVQAFREMAMSGFEYQEALESVPSVLTLASIGMMDFGQASDIATNILYGFGMQAEDLSRVVDVMAQAVTDSAQNVEQLGTTMSYVAPVAESFGLSIEAVTAATEVLVNAGIKGSRGGTGLRRVFTSLFSDNENIAKQLAELGVVVNTLAGDMDAELIRVFKELNEKTHGATVGMDNLNKAVGMYGIPSFLALIKSAGAGSKSLEELINKLRGVGGVAYEMKQRIEDNLAIDFEKLTSALSAVEEKIFFIFGDTLRKATQNLTAFIRGFAEDNSAIRDFVKQLKELGEVLWWMAQAAFWASLASGLVAVASSVGVLVKEIKAGATVLAMLETISARSIIGVIVKVAASLIMLKQGFDVYNSLTEVIPQVTEDTLNLSRAQKALNEELQGIVVSEGAEAFAMKAKDIKRTQVDLENQLEQVNKKIEQLNSTMEEMETASSGYETASRRLKDLKKQSENLAASLKKASTAFNNALRDLIDKELNIETEKKLDIVLDIRVSESELEKLKNELNKQQQLQRDMFGRQLSGISIDRIAYLQNNADIMDTQQSIGNLKRKIDALKASLETLESADSKSAVLQNVRNGLEAVSESAAVAEVRLASINKITGFLDEYKRKVEEVGEANRIEAMTTVEKLAHYEALHASYKDQIDLMEEYQQDIANTEAEIKRLEEASANKPLSKDDSDLLDSLKKKKEGYDNLLKGLLEQSPKALEALEQIGKLSVQAAEEMVKLKETLADLLHTKFEGEFPDTLKGNVDFLISQTDALIAKVNAVTDAYAGMSDAALEASSRPLDLGTAGQEDYAVVSGSPSMKGFGGYPTNIDDYVKKVGEANKMTEAQKDVLSGLMPTLLKLSETYDLNTEAVISLIQHESRFNKSALSPKNARGLMQVIPSTAKGVAEELGQVFDELKYYSGDAIYSLTLGMKELSNLVSRYGNDWNAVLAGWNAGTKAAERLKAGLSLGSVPKETQKLIADVTQRTLKADAAVEGLATREQVLTTTAVEAANSHATLGAETANVEEKAKDLAGAEDKVGNSFLKLAKDIITQRKAYAELSVTVEDFNKLRDKELEARAEAIELQKQFDDLMQRTDNGNSATQKEIAELERLKEKKEGLINQANQLYEKQGEVHAELIKQGKAEGLVYDLNIRKLQALSDSYDSVATRVRAYRQALEDIRVLEGKGLLTPAEATMERVEASIRNMSPLARDMSTAMAGMFKVMIAEGGATKNMIDDLRKSLIDMVMDKYVVKITTKLVGSVMDPLIRGLENAFMGLLSGMGSLFDGLLGSLFSLGGGSGGVGGALTGQGGFSLSGLFSGASNLFGVTKGITSLFSGATFAGIMQGFSSATTIIGGAGYFGGAGAALGLASGAASTGSYGIAIGASAPYLIPAIIAIGALAKAFGAFDDKTPRYGTLAAQTNGRTLGLEDSEWGDKSYTKGGFGLVFGITDKGSKNIEAPELKKTFDAMAEVSRAIEDYFGKDLSKQVQEYLDDLSNFGDGILHLTEDEGDVGGAVARMVQLIGQAAGRTTDEVGKAFFRLTGDLGGEVEEVQKQLQSVIAATSLAVQITDAWDTQLGKMFGLAGKSFDNDVATLMKHAASIKEEDEILADAFLRLVAEMQGLASASITTGQSLAGIKPEVLVQAADELSSLFMGVENLTKAVSFYTTNFMSAGESALIQVDALMEGLQSGFANLREKMAKDWDNTGEIVDMSKLDKLPQTREEFANLVKGIDLTTESGRQLYKALMDLAPGFDALFDAVESFEKWIDPLGETERATARVEAVFKSLGIQMPKSYEDFQKLYQSGKLSAEQMAVLAAILEDLGVVFEAVGESVKKTIGEIKSENADLQMRLLELIDPAAAKIEQRRREMEQTDPSNRFLLEQIYYAEDEIERINKAYEDRIELINDNYQKEQDALNDAYQAKVDAINAAYDSEIDAINAAYDSEVDSINATADARLEALSAEREAIEANYDAQTKALDEQMDAANKALSETDSIVSSITSALQRFRTQNIDTVDIDRANRQLAGYVSSGTLPDQDALSRMLDVLGQDSAARYATETDYLVSQNTTKANLLALEKMGSQEVDNAQKTVDLLQAQLDQAKLDYDAQLKALEDQEQQISDWRDQALQQAQDLQDAAQEAAQMRQDAALEAAKAQHEAALAAAEAAHEEALKQAEAWKTEQLDLLRQMLQAGIDTNNDGIIGNEGQEQTLAIAEQQLAVTTSWSEAELAKIDTMIATLSEGVTAQIGTYAEAQAFNAKLSAINSVLEMSNPADTNTWLSTISTDIKNGSAQIDTHVVAQMQAQQAENQKQTEELRALKAELAAMRKDMAAIGTATVTPLKAVEERLRYWEMEGLPASRDSVELLNA